MGFLTEIAQGKGLIFVSLRDAVKAIFCYTKCRLVSQFPSGCAVCLLASPQTSGASESKSSSCSLQQFRYSKCLSEMPAGCPTCTAELMVCGYPEAASGGPVCMSGLSVTSFSMQ